METQPQAPRSRTSEFLTNVLWTWIGVAATFAAGFLLNPYIIRTLGDLRYGMWALAFAFVDYYQIFDIGIRGAVVNLVSRARASGDAEKLNEILNTSFAYFAAQGSFLLISAWAVSGFLPRFFRISPGHEQEFVWLIRVMALGWAFAFALNTFPAALEGFQQFKTQNRISILGLTVRTGGSALVLAFGYGLVEMAAMVAVSQVIVFGLSFLAVRRGFPELRLGPSLMRRSTLKEMAGYGAHSFVAYVGLSFLNQAPPVLIGRTLSEAFVGYWALPTRLLQYVVEIVTRVATVTMPSSAELTAKGMWSQLARLGTALNRYSLMLILPFSIFLLIWGRELIAKWVGASFAENAAPLLPAFVFSTTLAIAGQYNSIGMLFGMARHQVYSRTLVLEGLLAFAGFLVVLPRYGIVGAAWAIAGLAVLNRGLVTPFLLCRYLDISYARFMGAIYVRPLLLAVPVTAGGLLLKQQMPGGTWFELLLALGALAAIYYAGAFFVVVEREHRTLFLSLAAKLLKRRGQPVSG